MSRIRRLARALRRSQRGYTLVELIIVMAMLGVVLTSLTAAFVTGSNTELDLNRRVQAQQAARLALDRLRVDIHCASAAQAQLVGGSYTGVKLAVGQCTAYTNTPTVSWCAVSVTSSPPRYALYRSTSTTNTCTPGDSTRVRVADYLTTDANVFTTGTIPQNAQQKVGVDIRVSVHPNGSDAYELTDAIVARNSTRCMTSGGCAAPTVS